MLSVNLCIAANLMRADGSCLSASFTLLGSQGFGVPGLEFEDPGLGFAV